MKRCRVCGEEKPLSQYSLIGGGPYYRGNCKPCGVIMQNEHRRKIRGAWATGDLQAVSKKRCSRCKETKVAADFRKSKFHKSGLAPYCRPCATEVEGKQRLGDIAGYLCRTAKSRAKQRGLDFDLKAEDIAIPEFCPALGTPLVYGSRQNNKLAASLDRIDNSKGYIRGNVIIVSRHANTIKNDATVEELGRVADFYRRLTKRAS